MYHSRGFVCHLVALIFAPATSAHPAPLGASDQLTGHLQHIPVLRAFSQQAARVQQIAQRIQDLSLRMRDACMYALLMAHTHIQQQIFLNF